MSRADRVITFIRDRLIPGAGLLLAAVAVWRVWPLDSLQEDAYPVAVSLFGLMCLLAPGSVADYWSLRGQGYSSYTSAEASSLQDDDVIKVIGLLLLGDAILGIGNRLLWGALG